MGFLILSQSELWKPVILQGRQQGPGQSYLVDSVQGHQSLVSATPLVVKTPAFYTAGIINTVKRKEINLQVWENETLQAHFEQSWIPTENNSALQKWPR